MDVMRQGFLARTPEEAEQHFQQAFRSGLRLSLTSEEFQYVLRMAGHPWFLTGTSRIRGARVSAQADARPALILNNIEGGRYEWRIGQQRHSGSTFIIPPGHSVTTTFDDFDISSVALDVDQVEAVARLVLGEDTVRLVFSGSSNEPRRDPSLFRAIISHLSSGALASDAALGNPIVVGQAIRYLVAVLVDTFPIVSQRRTYPLGGVAQEPGQSRAVRRAVLFIEEEADQPITTHDIAAATGLSVRAVQAAFRRELDLTPMQYLRRVRLDRCHQDLVDADPTEGVTVKQIAHRYGILQLGRFARDYREAYGELPRTTLKR